MSDYKNFYENQKEATMRLVSTIVCYDGIPCQVLAITAHKPDGIFRVYLDPIGQEHGGPARPDIDGVPRDHTGLGAIMDNFMDKHPGHLLMRKHMNSPAFNKYRPFPLGMLNVSGKTFYMERQPIVRWNKVYSVDGCRVSRLYFKRLVKNKFQQHCQSLLPQL